MPCLNLIEFIFFNYKCLADVIGFADQLMNKR